MSTKTGPDHVVVDGSNIATEGRSLPSLKQLQEAVMSFMEEYPDTAVTVVVDATFGHRIDKKESKDFEEGIANNELVAPPAGAVGRGDAFVLGIADKAGASVLSNDSFQEFHGDYEWLFDEGRLIGGKPVPHVGWVWVDRVPVRGPVSRKATGGRRGRRSSKARQGSKEASAPMPVPSSPPPTKKAAAKKSTGRKTAAKRTAAKTSTATEAPARGAPTGDQPVNDLMPFLDFVENHPAGTPVRGVVDAYSSHGAYVRIVDADVRAYVPLRLMADPPPRSAKQVMKTGEEVELVVVNYAASRRSIDCAVPALAEQALQDASSDEDLAAPETDSTASKKTATKKTATKKTAAKKTATKKTAAKKTATKKSATKKTAAKKKATTKKAAATKKTTAKKTATKKTAATKKAAGKKTAAKKTAAKKSAAKKTATKKAAAKRTAARKRTAT